MHKNNITALIGLLITLLLFTACGSDSGSHNPSIRVVSPANDTVFQAGSLINYELTTNDFSLAAPFDRRSLKNHPSMETNEHEDSHDHEQAEGHDDTEVTHEHSDSDSEGTETEHSDSHDHSNQNTNPNALEGHYHIYLDDASGSDEHITAWSYSGEYTLPEDISTGTHSLRFELRDNNHVLVGTPESETILFFEVE